MLKEEITSLLKEVLKSLAIPVEAVSVDYPADVQHGDYATNVALILAKKVAKTQWNWQKI